MVDEEDQNETDPHFLEYPESVQFTGTVETSLKSVHIISALVVVVGLLIAANTYPAGLVLMVVFLLIVFGFEVWMMKKSVKVLRITLYLRENPVQASQGTTMIGGIATGSVRTQMENFNELGYRASPKHPLQVWKFDSRNDAEIVAKRLLEYLSMDTSQS